MLKQQKKVAVEKISNIFTNNNACIFFKYSKFDMKSITSLKLQLKAQDANLLMVKNTLAKIAANKVFNDQNIAQIFKGHPMAIVYGEICSCAKIMQQFIKANKEMVCFVGGLSDKQLFSENQFDFFASLPSKEELQNKLIKAIIAPITSITKITALPMIALRKIHTVLCSEKEE